MLKNFSKKKKIMLGITLFILVGLTSVCAIYISKDKLSSDEIVITDADFAKADNKEIVITDSDFTDFNEQIKTAEKSGRQMEKTLGDNSQLVFSSDGFGNSSVTRFFKDHSRLNKILLRISAEGEKIIYVYGQDGKVKYLDAQMSEKVLKASADEIANVAKIYESREDKIRRAEEIDSSRREELKPLPSEEFPVYKQNVEFPQMKEPQPVTNPVETEGEAIPQSTKPQIAKQKNSPSENSQENEDE